MFRYNGEESDFLKHLHKNGRFLLSFKKKKKSHSVFNKEAIDSSEHNKRTRKSMESSDATAYSLGVRTRAQKRRIGERDVWDLIVNNDDICFKHILPRLNRTDVKFLYEVNTETRALIKRSTRANDLKEKFKIEEMSSISTLEFAWEHFPWGKEVRYGRGYMDEQYFCLRVAETNKLELLKWAREEKKCKWDFRTIDAAAFQDNLEMVKYCEANECPIDEFACANAA